MELTQQLVAELLDLFDEMLKLTEQELEWFSVNTPGNGDTEQLLRLASARQSLINTIDEKRDLLRQQSSVDLGEDLTGVMEKILQIDTQLQKKATDWMQDIKGKMQQGNVARQANTAYGVYRPPSGAAFFDGKR